MNSKYPHPFSKAAADFRKFRSKLPDAISTIAVNDFKENFERQGYVNKNGVLIPWKKLKNKKKKKKGILIQTGRLKRSLRKEPTYSKARVVSNSPYAAAHNEGVNETVKVKAHKRGGAAVKGHSRKMKLPKRTFMPEDSKSLNDEIEKHIFNEIDKIW